MICRTLAHRPHQVRNCYNEDEGLVIVEALCLGRPFHQGCQRFLSHAECVCISVRKKCIGTALELDALIRNTSYGVSKPGRLDRVFVFEPEMNPPTCVEDGIANLLIRKNQSRFMFVMSLHHYASCESDQAADLRAWQLRNQRFDLVFSQVPIPFNSLPSLKLLLLQ